MAYLVKFTSRAERDLDRLYAQINARDSDTVKWYRGLRDAVLSLEERQNRCRVTPDNRKLRHLLYGHKPHVYRVMYRVPEQQKQVEVLHIRHGAGGSSN